MSTIAEQRAEQLNAAAAEFRGRVAEIASEPDPIEVGDVVTYRSARMRGISFDHEGSTVTQPELRTGRVQALHDDGSLVVGEDDAAEWIEITGDDIVETGPAARNRRLRQRLAGMPLPIGAVGCDEWSSDLDDTGSRMVWWHRENVAHVSASVEAVQDQDGDLALFGVDLYAPDSEPFDADTMQALAAAMTTAAEVAELAATAVLVHAEMQRQGMTLAQLAEKVGLEPKELNTQFAGTNLVIPVLWRVRDALGADWADLLTKRRAHTGAVQA